jgi:hypothetical protein
MNRQGQRRQEERGVPGNPARIPESILDERFERLAGSSVFWIDPVRDLSYAFLSSGLMAPGLLA